MVKCELCNNKIEGINSCQNCETNYCSECGDFERELCKDCIDFNEAMSSDIEESEE